jgi:Kef-type K+ transport system membrane component KefB
MVPRGEVGLIFANVGATLTIGGRPVITPELYAALVLMVIFTTLVTPPALEWSLTRGPGAVPTERQLA